MVICMPFGMSCSVKGIKCCGRTNACVCNLFGTNCKVSETLCDRGNNTAITLQCTLGGFLFGRK